MTAQKLPPSPKVDFFQELYQLVHLLRLLEGLLDHPGVDREQRWVFLDGVVVMRDCGRVFARLGELVGDAVPELGVTRLEPGDALVHRLGLDAVSGSLVVIGESLVELQRLGRSLELGVGTCDQILQLARPSEHLDRLRRACSPSSK